MIHPVGMEICVIKKIDINDVSHLVLKALGDIPKGMELRNDYNESRGKLYWGGSKVCFVYPLGNASSGSIHFNLLIFFPLVSC